MDEIEAQVRKSFPVREEYMDCTGQIRVFELCLDRVLSPGYLLRAKEITEEEYCYEFEVFAESNPFIGFGRLREKIRRGMSRRYLVVNHSRLSMSHDEIAGSISYRGLIVDGQLLPWEELQKLLLTHEGFHIELRIRGGDEWPG